MKRVKCIEGQCLNRFFPVTLMAGRLHPREIPTLANGILAGSNDAQKRRSPLPSFLGAGSSERKLS